MTRRRRLVVCLIAFLTVAVGGAALAAWTHVISPAAIAGSVERLNAPSVTSPAAGNQNQSTTGITVTWTQANTTVGNVAAASYNVTRYKITGGTPDAGSIACGGAQTALTCSDTVPGDGLYAYTVQAVYKSWTRTSAQSGTVQVTTPDTTAPTQALSLTGVSNGNAFLNSANNTLYYKRDVGGNFKFVDAVTDNGSGPASLDFPAIATTGWTHNNEPTPSSSGAAPTVTYTSTAYTWTANPTNPANQTFVARDVANNPSNAVVSFVSDTVSPTGAVTAPTGNSTVGGTVAVTSSATDALSGVGSVRYEAKLGTGSFVAIGTVSSAPFTLNWDTTTVANGSYTLHAVVTDNVGNTFTTSSVTSVTVANSFAISAGATQTAGVPFNATITAKSNGSTNTNFNGTVTMTFSGPGNAPDNTAPAYPTSVTFNNGVGTASVTLYNAETVALTATAGNLSGTSSNITVAGGAVAGLKFTSCTKNGGTSTPCSSGVATGNGGSGTAKVSVLDAHGNLTVATTAINVTASLASTTNYSLTGTPTIAATATESATSFTVTHLNSGSNSTTLSTTNAGLTEDTITFQK